MSIQFISLEYKQSSEKCHVALGPPCTHRLIAHPVQVDIISLVVLDSFFPRVSVADGNGVDPRPERLPS